MIALQNRTPSEPTLNALAGYQSEIDQKDSYPERVAEARRIWPSRSQNAPFREVKTILTTMCSGARRCCYCEDSMADEVEHIWPKDFYPNKTFAWENYLYACGPCNGPKGSQFALFVDGNPELVVLEHPEEGPKDEPPPGAPVLINPRDEDPMGLLWLDIQDSFAFTSLDDDPASRAFRRARYTIDILKLNSRDNLLMARRNAYGNYRARLREYISQRDAGAIAEELHELIRGIQTEHHPTVWREMKRQHEGIPELLELFNQAPEALNW